VLLPSSLHLYPMDPPQCWKKEQHKLHAVLHEVVPRHKEEGEARGGGGECGGTIGVLE